MAGAFDLGVRLTGAAFSGAWHRNADDSLGGYPSSRPVTPLTVYRVGAIYGVVLEWAGGLNGAGIGGLEAVDEDSLRWTPPGTTTPGTAVVVADGSWGVLYGAGSDSDKFVVVRRVTSAVLQGSETVHLVDVVNNVVGGSNFSEAETTAGESHWRGVMFKNDGAVTISNVRVWFDGGENTDTMLAGETVVAGAIQVIPNETTSPVGLDWSNPTTEGTSLELATFLSAGVEVGLWIEQVIGALTVADPIVTTVLHYKFTAAAVTYYGTIRGVNRRAEAGLSNYLMFVGQDAEPDILGAADEEFDTFPFTTPAGVAADHVYYLVTAAQNAYGLRTVMSSSTVIRVEAGGGEGGIPPTAPSVVQGLAIAGGEITIYALYMPGIDGADLRADTWQIYLSVDGTDPDPDVDTPVEVEMGNQGFATAASPLTYTSTTLDAIEGAPIRYLLRTKRDSVASDNTFDSSHEVTAVWTGPARVDGVALLGDRLGVAQSDGTFSERTVYVDQPNNIYFLLKDGSTEFWGDSVLIWNMKRDPAYPLCDVADITPNGLFTFFEIVSGTVSGAGDGNVIEVASWTGPSKLLYANVGVGNGTRRLKIDVTNAQITVGLMGPRSVLASTYSDEPAVKLYSASAFQCWDRRRGGYRTGCSVNLVGEWTWDIPLTLVVDQAAAL